MPRIRSTGSHFKRNAAIVAILILALALLTIPLLPGGAPNIHFRNSPPIATGIADYGQVSRNGSLSRYRTVFSQVTARATIYSLEARGSANDSNVVSLQLNTYLYVNSTGGNQVFWVQNIAFFDTNSDFLNFNNEIWNETSPSASLTNETISGTAGDVVVKGTIASVKGYETYYSLPLDFDFYTNESRVPNGVEIMMGYQMKSGASQVKGIYDIISIEINGVTGTGFVVNGFSYDPASELYDTELVFGGPPGGTVTTFSLMNSTLSFRYTLLSGTEVVPVAVWEFGTTEETASNLQTNFDNGTFVVTIGKVDFNRDYPLS
jgi:hypothetical protein